MKPPYRLTAAILNGISSVSEKVGAFKASHLDRPSPELRKTNRVKTVHHSLQIEGNSLSEAQITALLEGKRVVGPRKDIVEVQNALEAYRRISQWKGTNEKSFLKAHGLLMKDLLSPAGTYRKEGVGIVKGGEVQHYAPPHDRVPFLMNDLFSYLKTSDDPALIKSCVFHYEVEFIHPFLDGNGRIGRLWQTVLLSEWHDLFSFLPFETLIRQQQEEYYRVLELCDKAGNSTAFIEFMLGIIAAALDELIDRNRQPKTPEERLRYFLEKHSGAFTRGDYRKLFKDISLATASRDLQSAVALGLLARSGDKRNTVYRLPDEG
jgi:Fic family protein